MSVIFQRWVMEAVRSWVSAVVVAPLVVHAVLPPTGDVLERKVDVEREFNRSRLAIDGHPIMSRILVKPPSQIRICSSLDVLCGDAELFMVKVGFELRHAHVGN